LPHPVYIQQVLSRISTEDKNAFSSRPLAVLAHSCHYRICPSYLSLSESVSLRLLVEAVWGCPLQHATQYSRNRHAQLHRSELWTGP